MKIVFWSPVHGQTATTSNFLTVAISSVLNYNIKSLITQSHYSLNNLENSLLGKSTKSMRENFSDIGIDALSRNLMSGKMDQEAVDYACISLLGKKLNFLPGTTKSCEDMYQKEMIKTLPFILKECEKYHDLVFIDTNAGNRNELTRVLINQADLLVVNLCQNKTIIDDYFENYNFDKDKTFYLLGNYNYKSQLNINNLISKYKQFNKNNLGAVPYNVNYLDAQSSGTVIPYLTRNKDCSKNDSNFYFIQTVKKSTDLILKKIDETQNSGRRKSG